MAQALIALVGVAALAAMTSAQPGCALGDHANCANWVRNGFCQNSAYSQAQLKQYCPKSCANAGCGGGASPTGTTTVATPTKENANCGKWNESPTNIFCAKATPESKKNFCFTTCKEEITPTEECAVYLKKGDKVAPALWQAKDANTAAPTSMPTGGAAGDEVVYVYVKTACTLTLQKADGTTAGTAKTGAANAEFVEITVADEKAATQFTCTC